MGVCLIVGGGIEVVTENVAIRMRPAS